MAVETARQTFHQKIADKNCAIFELTQNIDVGLRHDNQKFTIAFQIVNRV